MSDPSSPYRTNWNSYWQDIGASGRALWDSDPAIEVEGHLALFRDLFDPALPLIDVGCGNGTQTRRLAEAFPRVVAVDVSEEALALATEIHAAPNLQYRKLDLLDEAAATALHAEIGDSNVYVRAVLQQLLVPDRPPAVANLATLLGHRGKAFLVELSPTLAAFMDSLAQRGVRSLPEIARIRAHGIQSIPRTEGDIPDLFAQHGFGTNRSGTTVVRTIQPLPDGSLLENPADWWLLQRYESPAVVPG